MLFKKMLFIVAFVLAPVVYIKASDKAVLDAVNKLSRDVSNIKADVYRLSKDSTPEAIHNFSDAIRDGVRVEHSIKVPYSAIFGFSTCLSLYSLWRGAVNYLNSHKTKQIDESKANKEIAENKKSASWQIGMSLCCLAASCIGLYKSH